MRPEWKSMTPAERADAVRPLVKEELSASEIARHFVGASRNAVIGVVHRNGMALARSGQKPRESKPAPRPLPSGQRSAHPVLPPEPAHATPTVASPPEAAPPTMKATKPVLFTATVANQCRWPLWDFHDKPKADAMFVCGAPTPEGRPYCVHHAEQSRGEGMPCERRAVRAAMAVKG